MQARILRDELIRFKSQSANITTNTLMPILTYIKIEIDDGNISIIKNNLEAFIISKTYNQESLMPEIISFLVVEKILFNFIEFSEDQYIEFEQIRNRIKISDSRSFVESPTDRPQDFPAIDLSSSTWTPISKPTLDAAGVAAKLIFTSELDGPKSNVFIGQNHVGGTDGAVGYCKEITDVVPDIAIRKNIAETIASMPNCEYSFNKSYDYFKDPVGTIFGFSRIESKFFNLAPLFGNLEGKQYEFSFSKSLMIKFCQLCINSIDSKKELSSAIFRSENKSLILTMEGSDIKIESNSAVTAEVGNFKFNPDRMKVLLEALQCETVYFYKGPERYFITDKDITFMSVIMGII